MTVISTVLSRYCTAHASDSWVSVLKDDGTREVLDRETTKIICVRRWAGAMVYCGLAVNQNRGRWSTFEWLRERASRAQQFAHPEEFAQSLGEQLNQTLDKMIFRQPIDKGIGVYLSVYEHVDDYLIPELFAITNFENTSYQELHRDGIHVTRETFNSVRDVYNNQLQGNSPFINDNSTRDEHSKPQYRHEVRKFLEAGGMLIFNNGDPVMFNSAANAIFDMLRLGAYHRRLKPIKSPKAHRNLAKWPIDLVSRIQRHFFQDEFQLVGGKLHDLSITPDGEYASDTGDKC